MPRPFSATEPTSTLTTDHKGLIFYLLRRGHELSTCESQFVKLLEAQAIAVTASTPAAADTLRRRGITRASGKQRHAMQARHARQAPRPMTWGAAAWAWQSAAACGVCAGRSSWAIPQNDATVEEGTSNVGHRGSGPVMGRRSPLTCDGKNFGMDSENRCDLSGRRSFGINVTLAASGSS